MTATHPTAGRPRDPEVDRRIMEAATALFGESGWAGFSMEAVARRAGVGKASLYLRWSGKEALLSDVVRGFATVADADTGTLRGDLTSLAVQLLTLYTGPGRLAALRISLEGELIPSVAEQYNRISESQIRAALAMARRGIDRGELPADAPVTLLLETLAGSTLMHALAAPTHPAPTLAAPTHPASPGGDPERAVDIETHAERLVSLLLRAVGA